MPYLIGGLIAIVLVVWLVGGVTVILAYVTAMLAIPSMIAMRLVQAMGFTDPGWYVALHAMAGAAIGFWGHLVSRFLERFRKRPSAKGGQGLWARSPRWLKVILVLLLVLFFLGNVPNLLMLLDTLSRR